MQQHRITLIRAFMTLRSLVITIPKCSTAIEAVTAHKQQTPYLAFHRYLTQAAATKSTKTKTNDPKENKLQQKITLIGQNQAISITTLDEAQKLAKRRDLHLVRLQQPEAKTGRAMFKLVTAAEMLADEPIGKDSTKNTAMEKGSKKSEKSLTIGGRMTDHDLSSRLKNIIKWLNKQYEIRILIQGNVTGADASNTERIFKSIESTIKEPQVIGKIVQRHQKGGSIKFNIIPVATASEATKAQLTTEPPISPSPPSAKQS